MIKTENLNKYFNKGKANEIHVINDNNITLPNTGLVTILGDSGSGKTTLLNVLGGLDSFQGKILYDDLELNKYDSNKIDDYRSKNFGYIFQNYYLITELSIYDNLRKQLEIMNIIDEKEVKKRIDYALKTVKLYKYKNKKPDELSGGQQQRVSIARALVKKCKVLICDEPTGNLDSQNSLDVMNILKKLSEKTLVLLVTHDKKLASFYSDIIYTIVDGKITNVEENSKSAMYIDDDSNNVYLQDMNKKDEGNITIYSNEENIPDVEIELVNINGTYYIKSNVKLKLQSESNLIFKDEKHQAKTIDDVKNEIEFDNSHYEDIYETNKGKMFFKSFGMAFKNYHRASKKSKFFRIIFIIIGLLMSFINYGFISQSKVLSNDRNPYDPIRSDIYYGEDIDSTLKNNLKDYLVVLRPSGVSLNYYENAYKEKNEFINFNIIYGSFEKYKYKNETIIEGRDVTNEDELLLDKSTANQFMKALHLRNYIDLLNLEVNDYTVVGVTDGKTNVCYTSNDGSVFDKIYTYKLTNEELKALDTNNQLIKYETYLKQQYKNEMAPIIKSRNVMIGIIISLFVVASLYIYFTMRTKLISDVKRIGILRSIGMKKSKIRLDNIFEIMVITLFTTLVGFLIGTLIIALFVNKFGAIIGPDFNINLFTHYITYLYIVLLFILNLIFGIIPVNSLLRKTPNEINTKYDI